MNTSDNENAGMTELEKRQKNMSREMKVTAENYVELAMRTKADQQAILDRLAQLGPKAMQLVNAFIGGATDFGELGDPIRRWIEYRNDGSLDQVNMKEEIGDVLWRLAQMCEVFGFTLQDVMEANIRKLQARYGEKYSDFKANNRNLDAERKVLEMGFSEQKAQLKAREEYVRRSSCNHTALTIIGDQATCECGWSAPASVAAEHYNKVMKQENCSHVHTRDYSAQKDDPRKICISCGKLVVVNTTHFQVPNSVGDPMCVEIQTGQGFAEPPDDSQKTPEGDQGKLIDPWQVAWSMLDAYADGQNREIALRHLADAKARWEKQNVQ